MEEEIKHHQQQQHQHQQHSPPTAITTRTTTTTTLTAKSDTDSSRSSSYNSHLLQEKIGVGDSSSSSSSSITMGGNRSGSTSSSVGWMGEGGEGNNSNNNNTNSSTTTSTTTTTTTSTSTTTSKTPTTPRQPTNRDSGYHTDFSFSPATFSSQPLFTFDVPPYHDTDSPAAGSSSSLGSSSHQQGSSSSELTSPRLGSTLLPPPPPRAALAAGTGWQPRRVLPDVDSDDEGDDDAFVSDNVTIAATSHLPGLHVIPAARRDAQQQQASFPRCAVVNPSGFRRQSPHVETHRDQDDDDVRREREGGGGGESRLRGGEEDEEEEVVDGRRSVRTDSRTYSLRSVAFRSGGFRRVVDIADDPCSDNDHDDNDDDNDEEEEGEGVSCTDYHHAPFSLVTLPGGERIRPLLARTIATQTPHLHCQLIDQILDCPQDFPQIARGSAVRRLRYYSEGEETVGVSSLARGPLPDLVPVTQGHRERSLSAPDLESLQRQRMAAREVGRELRRISDEFVRNHEALRDLHHQHPAHGALAAMHAELNGVAAFFLTGVRRFLYRGFAGYFRHMFHWTRQAMAASRTERAPPRRDSSVDQYR